MWTVDHTLLSTLNILLWHQYLEATLNLRKTSNRQDTTPQQLEVLSVMPGLLDYSFTHAMTWQRLTHSPPGRNKKSVRKPESKCSKAAGKGVINSHLEKACPRVRKTWVEASSKPNNKYLGAPFHLISEKANTTDWPQISLRTWRTGRASHLPGGGSGGIPVLWLSGKRAINYTLTK